MNYKVWLITFGIVAALVIGGSGFYAFSGYGKYSDALQNWDDKVGTIESLERRVPYPNKANSEALGEKVAQYEQSVEELFKSLDTFQSPLDTTLTGPEFQRKVKDRVQEFRKYAEDGGLVITDASDFQMGFDAYSNSIPPQDLVAVLDYELGAIDYLLRSLVDVGSSSLVSFERDLIPGEAGAPNGHESSVVHKYPVRLRFSGQHDSFQALINKLANDTAFFYVVRVLKVRNEVTEGPVKLTAAQQSSLPMFENPNTKEVASFERLEEWGYPTVSDEELATVARENGFISSAKDARVLMGQENLNVFMVVDVVRFISPEEMAANEKTKAEDDRGGRKR
ncbi:MAG: Amuc_1100 family pilus-like protein [Verrucomicrobiales bacterium]|nr:Amuc_1100 family pilus-like protein [Verrucomicrobiales bacterium]